MAYLLPIIIHVAWFGKHSHRFQSVGGGHIRPLLINLSLGEVAPQVSID
ncbi:uncharacterized protein METZ01_LOCUS1151 [marine metagenome]|uniref:Uncharacterized protein n=1 Tax=marine metagenome TaxID=408172 RepID=A0A381N182_9ZZZZ